MRWDEGTAGTWAQMLARLQQPFASPFASFNLAGEQGARLYEAQMRMLGETLQRFAGGFVERQQRSAAPIGMRELYDLWIDCAEAAYAGLARDPAFVAAQAAAINAAYGAFGEPPPPAAPTGAEIEALRQRIAMLEGQLQSQPVRKDEPADKARPARKAKSAPKAKPARKAKSARKAKPVGKAQPTRKARPK